MGILEIGALVGGGILALFRLTKTRRDAVAKALAMETIAYVVSRVVRELEATDRKSFGDKLTSSNAFTLKKRAFGLVMEHLGPKLKSLGKTLGIANLADLLNGEIERQVKILKEGGYAN